MYATHLILYLVTEEWWAHPHHINTQILQGVLLIFTYIVLVCGLMKVMISPEIQTTEGLVLNKVPRYLLSCFIYFLVYYLNIIPWGVISLLLDKRILTYKNRTIILLISLSLWIFLYSCKNLCTLLSVNIIFGRVNLLEERGQFFSFLGYNKISQILLNSLLLFLLLLSLLLLS